MAPYNPSPTANSQANILAGLESAKQQALKIQSSLQTLTQKGYGNVDISQIPQNVQINQLPQYQAPTPQELAATDITNQLNSLGLPPGAANTIANNPQALAVYQSLANQNKQYQTNQQNLLSQYSALQQSIGQVQESPELVQLRQAVAQQQRALKELTPAKYLESQPGLKGIGISQGFLDRRVAAEREPISSALSDLLMSESILGEQEEKKRKALQDQAQMLQQQFGLQKELYQMSQPSGLQEDLLKSFLFPQQPTQQNIPASIQEYQFSQQQPGFAQFLQGGKQSDLQRQLLESQIGATNALAAQRLSGIGGTSGGAVLPKLSPARQEDLANTDVLLQLNNQILKLGEQLNWSGVGGLGQGSIKQFFAKNFGTGTQQEQELRNVISNVKGTIAKLRGGTSFTTNEQKLLESYTPGINDSPLVIQSKIKSLNEFLQSKRGAIIGAAGGQSSSGTANIQDLRTKYNY